MNNVKIKFSSAAQSEGAATGVNTITALSEMYNELSILDELRSDMFEISGVESILDPPPDKVSLQNLVDLEIVELAVVLLITKLVGKMLLAENFGRPKL